MTNGSDRTRWTDERLDRLASFIFANAEAIRESSERLTIVEQLTQSNSRAIQALTDDIAELKLVIAADHDGSREERAELRQATIGIANLLSSLDSDRPTILRKLNTIETKVDRLLERGDGNGDEPQG